MGYVLRMPKLGLEMERGTVVEWHHDVDDAVGADDVVAEIESDKAVGEVTARESGTLREILVDTGTVVATGAPLGIVADADESIEALLAEVSEGAVDRTETTTDDEGTTAAGGEARAPDAASAGVDGADDGAMREPATGPEPGAAGGAVRATPRAKALARERALALADVDGTGPGGAIVGADVERTTTAGDGETTGAEQETAVADRKTAGGTEPSGPPVAETRPLEGVRQQVADRMSKSVTEAPQVTLHREIEAGMLEEVTGVIADQGSESVSTVDVFLSLLSAALSDHPALNGRFEEGTHRVAATQNVGYAVASDQGLVTPVVHGLESLSIREIASRRGELVDRVLAGEQRSADLGNGTFTVTNLGPYDVDEFTAILNPPEVAILGLGRIQDEPVRTEDGVAFERRLPVSLTVDHRALDGADGAAFLQTLATYVEEPRLLLLAD